MATPVITGVTVLYPQNRTYKHPGEPATIVVDAFDSDNVQIEISVKVKDSAGNATTQKTFVVQNDPLIYEANTVTVGHTVTPGSNPNEFIVI